MIITSHEVVWLTSKELEIAVREYVKSKGFDVKSYARVTFSGNVTHQGEIASVSIHSSSNKVLDK